MVYKAILSLFIADIRQVYFFAFVSHICMMQIQIKIKSISETIGWGGGFFKIKGGGVKGNFLKIGGGGRKKFII